MAKRPTAPVVLKFGGELLEQPADVRRLARSLSRLARATPLVIVHGGGREIDAALVRAGIEKRQVEGLRITDEATLEVVVAVLAGAINTRLVAALGAAGVSAVGLTGADARLGLVRPARPHRTAAGAVVDLGRVGEPAGGGPPALLDDLCRAGYVPVVASIGVARDGRLYNVNADTLAASLAARLTAPRLVIAGATRGVYDERGATIPELTLPAARTMIRGGQASAGMIAKLTACRAALAGGARDVVIADGRDADGLAAIARSGRAGSGTGTRIVRSAPAVRGRTARGR